jgi:hypothetical protein
LSDDLKQRKSNIMNTYAHRESFTRTSIRTAIGLGALKTQRVRVLAGTAVTAACVSAVAFCGTPATATADPTDNQANNDKLFALLSGGFTPADCQAQGGVKPSDPFLAHIACHRSIPGGPYAADYTLYGNPPNVNEPFNYPAIPCPGSTDAGPIPWQGGMMKCAHNVYPASSGFVVTWTRDADFVVANAFGVDLAALYGWWLGAH